MDESNFDKILNEFDSKKIENHTIVKAKVISITKENVTLDIGTKQEAEVPISEFYNNLNEINLKVGDEIEIYVVNANGKNGPVVSRKKAFEKQVRDQLKEAFVNNTPVSGKIHQKIKDGYLVDLGVLAFMPMSHSKYDHERENVSIDDIKNFKVIKFEDSTGDIVVSIKKYIDDIKEEKQKKTKERLKVGEVFSGTVKNIIKTGLFVDIGGYEGYVNIKDISYTKIDNISNYIKINSTVNVKVLEINLEKGILKLGMKQLDENPYFEIEKKFPVNSIVKGKITGIQQYGLFVEIAKGIDGFLHTSEISWLDKKINLEKEFKTGQYITVKILKYDIEKQKISLSFKQTTENPWEKISTKYKVNDIICGEVSSITNFGIFVKIEEGIEGLIHISEVSWGSKENINLSGLKVGDMVECLLLAIEPSNEKLSLSLKRKNTDPLLKHKIGEDIECKIIRITDNLVNVFTKDNIDGVILKNNISQKKFDTISDIVKINDKVFATIINIDKNKRRLELSIKEYLHKLDRKEVEEFSKYSDIKLTIGQILKSKAED